MFIDVRNQAKNRLPKIIRAIIVLFAITFSSNVFSSPIIEIFNNQAVTTYGDAKSANHFKVVIPPGGTRNISVSMDYQSGSANLIFYRGPEITNPEYCQYTENAAQNLQQCQFDVLDEGTYYVEVSSDQDSFFGTLLASYSKKLGIVELEPGIWYEPTGIAGENYDFTVTLPEGAREFVLEFKPSEYGSGNTSNAELQFTPQPRVNGVPTSYINCPLPGNTYECAYWVLEAGTYDIRLKANADFTSPKLLVRYAVPIDINQIKTLKPGHKNARLDFYYLPTGDEQNALVKLNGDVENVVMTVHNGVDKNDFSTVCETEQLSATKEFCQMTGSMTTFGYYYIALRGAEDFRKLKLALTIPE